MKKLKKSVFYNYYKKCIFDLLILLYFGKMVDVKESQKKEVNYDNE